MMKYPKFLSFQGYNRVSHEILRIPAGSTNVQVSGENEVLGVFKMFFCQAPSQIPNPQGPAPTQSNPVKISSKGTGADTKILWATPTL